MSRSSTASAAWPCCGSCSAIAGTSSAAASRSTAAPCATSSSRPTWAWTCSSSSAGSSCSFQWSSTGRSATTGVRAATCGSHRSRLLRRARAQLTLVRFDHRRAEARPGRVAVARAVLARRGARRLEGRLRRERRHVDDVRRGALLLSRSPSSRPGTAGVRSSVSRVAFAGAEVWHLSTLKLPAARRELRDRVGGDGAGAAPHGACVPGLPRTVRDRDDGGLAVREDARAPRAARVRMPCSSSPQRSPVRSRSRTSADWEGAGNVAGPFDHWVKTADRTFFFGVLVLATALATSRSPVAVGQSRQPDARTHLLRDLPRASADHRARHPSPRARMSGRRATPSSSCSRERSSRSRSSPVRCRGATSRSRSAGGHAARRGRVVPLSRTTRRRCCVPLRSLRRGRSVGTCSSDSRIARARASCGRRRKRGRLTIRTSARASPARPRPRR